MRHDRFGICNTRYLDRRRRDKPRVSIFAARVLSISPEASSYLNGTTAAGSGQEPWLRVSGARGRASWAWSGGDLALALTMTRGEPDPGWVQCTY